ncbi:MAG: rhomboid family intramembrane serine protease [Actinomycetota bacterium]|nr:rhomboid family intramembrane serine protease [Actinomycetota bacterium]
MIPIRDENPTSRTAWVTLAIIALNVLAFMAWEPTFNPGQNGVNQQLFFFCHAEIPWEVTHHTSLAQGGAPARAAIDQEIPGEGAALQQVLQRRCPTKSWWQSVFVAMFLHESWLHIGGNMLFLWVFGNNVEDKIGPLAYIVFYFASGIIASATQILTGVNSIIPSLGASGAIAGVLGAYLVMFPRRRVLSLVPVFLIFSLISLPAVVVLGFWFVLQFFSGATSLAQHVNGGVAYFAHIGGFVTGVIAALLFFPKEPWRRPTAPPPIW